MLTGETLHQAREDAIQQLDELLEELNVDPSGNSEIMSAICDDYKRIVDLIHPVPEEN